jgi:signal transduction histidine kinase
MAPESLGNLAHELRTPIQVLVGYIDLLHENLSTTADEETLEILERMNANVQELAQTLDNLMEHALAQANAPATATKEEVGARNLIAEVSPALEAANARKRLRLSFDLSQAPETIRASRHALRSIVLNLGLNAIKFTDSGSVAIALRRVTAINGEDYEIEVSDTGPGMSQWMFRQALKPFAQLSTGNARRHRGLGLGLAVTQRNVALLGGQLELRSVLGQGSRFTARFPASRNVPLPRRTLAGRPPATPPLTLQPPLGKPTGSPRTR